MTTVQMIFKAKNDRGEPLIEVAARQGEIWTARAKTDLLPGDKVLLKQGRLRPPKIEGVVDEIRIITLGRWSLRCGFDHKYLELSHEICKLAGFNSMFTWIMTYYDLNPSVVNKESDLRTGDSDAIVYLIHITNIKPYSPPHKPRGVK